MSMNSASSAPTVAQSLSQHTLTEVGAISENGLKTTTDYNSLGIVEESDQAQLLETLQTIVSLDTSQTTSVSQQINSELLQVTSPLSQISLPNLSNNSLLHFPSSMNNSVISTWLNNKIVFKPPDSVSSGTLPPVTELHPALRSASDLTLLGLSQASSVAAPCTAGVQPTSNLKVPNSTNQTDFSNEIGSLPIVSVAKVKIPSVKRPSLPQSLTLNSLSTLPLPSGTQHFEVLSNNLLPSQLMEQDSILNSLSSNLLSNNVTNNTHSTNTLMKALGINGQDENLSVMTNSCNVNLNTQSLTISLTDAQPQNKNISSSPMSQASHSHSSDATNQTLTLSATTLMSPSAASAGQLKNLESNSLQPDCSDESVFSSFVEETRCFKCKFCTYISLSKYLVISHIKVSHNKNAEAMHSLNLSNNSVKPKGRMKQTRATTPKKSGGRSTINCNSNITAMPSNLSNAVIQNDTLSTASEEANNRFLCGKCRKGFSSLEGCRQHMIVDHNVRSKRVRLERVSDPKTTGRANQANHISGNILSTKSGRTLLELLNTPAAVQLAAKTSPKTAPKSKNARNEPEIKLVITMKKEKGEITYRQKVWKRKLKREQGSYICEFKGCNARFHEQSNLEYHCKCHVNGSSGFMCPECETQLEHWGPLSGHLWRHHSLDLELYACDQCSFRTYSLSKLENLHKRIHQDERPYLCDTCGKGFKTSKQRLNHKAIHVEKRQQRGGQFRSGECPVCYRHFADKRMLRIHLDTVHNKIRPFLCNYCGYTASCKSTLKMHMRQHTGEKPFSCDMCDYRTADHNSLRRHKMRHSGEKPYKCPYCPYACIQSSTYKTHLKNKHPGQDDGLMFSCAHCSFRTIKHDTYITHMAGHKIQTIPSTSNSTSIAIGLQAVKTHSTPQRNSTVPLVEAMNIGMGNAINDNVSASQFIFNPLSEAEEKTIPKVLS